MAGGGGGLGAVAQVRRAVAEGGVAVEEALVGRLHPAGAQVDHCKNKGRRKRRMSE